MKLSPFPAVHYLLVVLLFIISFIHYNRSGSTMLTGGDQGGYYVYLPSVFIYHDLGDYRRTLEAAHQYRNDGSSQNLLSGILVPVPSTDKLYDKYTLGVALLDIPFFLLAHAIAWLSGYPMDGYSFPYSFLVQIAGMIYVLIGLWFLLKTLREKFSTAVSGIVILVLGFATNLYFFSVINSSMAHSYLFFLYCLLIYETVQWYKIFNWKNILIMGFCCGMITLIRPNEILCIFIPLLYDITGKKDFKKRLKLVIGEYKSLIAALSVFLLVILPQLLYWKFATGHLLFYSYGNESFDFEHPHIARGIFGWKNGWLSYTPVMFFSLAGIPLLWKKGKEFLLPILVILPVYIYIIYSWYCWSYINGFGSRPMVELYPLLAFPLGMFIGFVWQSKLFRALLMMLFTFFSALNIFNTYQFSRGVMWTEDGNFQYYLSALGKTKMDVRMLTTYDLGVYQPKHLKYLRTIFLDKFEDSVDHHYTKDSYEGGLAYQMTPQDEISKIDTLWQSTMNLKAGEYLKISFQAKKQTVQPKLYSMIIFISQFVVKGEAGDWQWVRVDNKLSDKDFSIWWGYTGKWYEVSFFIKPPPEVQQADFLKLFLVNSCKCDELKLDDLKVEVWK